MTDTILTSRAGGILTLTLNRPDALNAFTVEMKEALLAALRDAARNKEVRVVILPGAGQDHDADFLVACRIPEGGEQRFLHLYRERVERVRSIEGKRQYSASTRSEDGVRHLDRRLSSEYVA